MHIRQFSKRGEYHQRLNQENQDYLVSKDEKEYLAIMLADGATACQRGLDGARLCCEAATQVIETKGIEFFRYPKEKIAYLLKEHVLYWIECCKRAYVDIQEYGSTFILAFMEKKTGRTVVINLGDGAVLKKGKNSLFYILKPKRYRGNPCLTVTEGVQEAMEIQTLKLSMGEGIFLCSDGFLEQAQLREAISLVKMQDMDVLDCSLDSAEIADDCSYITFTRER